MPLHAKGYNCYKCGKSVFERDLEANKGGVLNQRVYCEEHYKEMLKMAALKTQVLDDKGKQVP